MSTIYSAGQYDDAFTPKKLGNWESTAKQSYPFRKTPKLHIPKIIVDSRGHLLPWVTRGDRTSSWGLLNYHLRNKFNRSRSMVFMSGPGKQATTTSSNSSGQSGSSSIQKRLRKLPKYIPRRKENLPPPDLLLEYLQHLSLPVVWIIGPSTRNTFQKRKQFSKQLAASLGFGFVNLDEKIQEWKERQQICTCSVTTTTGVPPLSPPHGPLHSLAQTSIAPSKLPTNVPPFISPNIPSPPPEAGGGGDASEYILKILETQRIIFDTALPIERNKILELYKFAMAECLPCGGFIMDSVPFDLVEGLQFEKVFYPPALAIYFTEGVPQKKQKIRPKDRRVTANTASSSSTQSTKKVLMSPLDYLERSRKLHENVYLKTRSHKRLGVFNLAEGEKICKQFGSKTIRIINAEDVERDTMDFLNELVRKNLERYQESSEGNAKLDLGVDQIIHCGPSYPTAPSNVQAPPPPFTYSSSFCLEEEEQSVLPKKEAFEENSRYSSSIRRDANPGSTNMPPALVTAHQSETCLLSPPNIFDASERSCSSVGTSVAAMPPSLVPEEQVNAAEDAVVEIEEEKKEAAEVRNHAEYKDKFVVTSAQTDQSTAFGNYYIDNDSGGAGDHIDHPVISRKADLCAAAVVPEGRKSAELWERIVKLESKVAELNTPEESSLQENQAKESAADETEVDPLPPPTAYAEDDDHENFENEDQEKFTTAIRNAIGLNCGTAAVTALHHYPQQQRQEYHHNAASPQNYHSPHQSLINYYDYGASGDCGAAPNADGTMPQQQENYPNNNYPNCHHYQHQSQDQSGTVYRKKPLTQYSQQTNSNDPYINSNTDSQQKDSFYDDDDE